MLTGDVGGHVGRHTEQHEGGHRVDEHEQDVVERGERRPALAERSEVERVETRAERMPPSAPESSRNGGMSTSRAGNAQERLRALLDRDACEHVDEPRHHEDRARTR